jgi:hypothetical protein
MKNQTFYDNLSVTVGWSGYPQIVENNDGRILYAKTLDLRFYKECYPKQEIDEWPINPYTNEKLQIYESTKQISSNKRRNEFGRGLWKQWIVYYSNIKQNLFTSNIFR